MRRCRLRSRIRAALAVPLAALTVLLASCGGPAPVEKAPPKPDGVYGGARPSVSPDGTRILFSGHYRGRNVLFTTDLDGGNLRTVLARARGLHSPVWSPDGKAIACALDLSGDGRGAVALLNADGTGFRLLTPDRSRQDSYDRYPTFTPDGTRVVFQRSQKHAFMQEFWLIPRDGGEANQLPGEIAWHPTPQVFSPDGQQMLFGQMVKIAFQDDKKIFPYRIFDLDLISGKQETVGLLGRSTPAVSPDGQTLLYTGTDDAALFLADREGKNPRRVFYAESKCRTPLFSPDGRHIVFLHVKERWSTRATITLLHVVTGEAREVVPDWSTLDR